MIAAVNKDGNPRAVQVQTSATSPVHINTALSSTYLSQMDPVHTPPFCFLDPVSTDLPSWKATGIWGLCSVCMRACACVRSCVCVCVVCVRACVSCCKFWTCLLLFVKHDVNITSPDGTPLWYSLISYSQYYVTGRHATAVFLNFLQSILCHRTARHCGIP